MSDLRTYIIRVVPTGTRQQEALRELAASGTRFTRKSAWPVGKKQVQLGPWLVKLKSHVPQKFVSVLPLFGRFGRAKHDRPYLKFVSPPRSEGGKSHSTGERAEMCAPLGLETSQTSPIRAVGLFQEGEVRLT